MPRPAALAVALACTGLVTAGLAVPAGAAAAEQAEPLRGCTTLSSSVDVGPPEGRRTCEVVVDLRVPAGVTSATPAPGAVLATRTAPGRSGTARTPPASPSRATSRCPAPHPLEELVAAARVPDVTPKRITLPGVVHRFAAGHRGQLVLSAADATCTRTGLPGTLTVVDSTFAPDVLTLPLAGR